MLEIEDLKIGDILVCVDVIGLCEPVLTYGEKYVYKGQNGIVGRHYINTTCNTGEVLTFNILRFKKN